MVWTTEGNGEVKIYVNNSLASTQPEVTAEDIKRIAREKQIRKFTVTDEQGNELEAEDFPITTGSVYIDEYNEAK